jgi:DinB superfamily
LQFQLNGSFSVLTQALEGMTDEEWQARPFRGANLIGFTAWHCARTVDWAVNCVLRASPELADLAEWRDVQVAGALFGAGASREAADSVPRAVTRVRVLEYLTALRAQTLEWLGAVQPDEWSGTVDLRASHAAKPQYTTPEVQAEIADLDGIPRWQFVSRPSISHIRVHSGEIASQLEAMRAAASA